MKRKTKILKQLRFCMWVLLFCATGFSGGPLPTLDLENKKNGIDPKEAGQFWNTWKLVSVRYRTDSQEQRFVFANSIAWGALKTGTRPYPKGSMFGKIAFQTAPDASFPASREPGQFARVQLMKKTGKANAETAGWAYALYIPNGLPSTFTPEEEQVACHACHTLVPKRDYVFSSPLFLVAAPVDTESSLKEQFKQVKVTELNSEILQSVLRNVMQNAPSHILAIDMPIFQGTVQESLSTLITIAKEEKKSYLIYNSKMKDSFILVTPQNHLKNCHQSGKFFQSLGIGKKDLVAGEYCDEKLNTNLALEVSHQRKGVMQWWDFIKDFVKAWF